MDIMSNQVLLTEQKSSAEQRMAIYALQKQLQIVELKELLFCVGFAGLAVFGRKLMEPVPSMEPITFFAMLSGWMFGRNKAAAVGATSLLMSNMLMFGGNGLWSIFQAAGFAAAGYLGGFLRKKASILQVGVMTIAAVVWFELVMNTSSMLFLGLNPLLAFLPAMPFGIIHLTTALVFALAMPSVKNLLWKKGGFDEKEIAQKLLRKIRSRNSS